MEKADDVYRKLDEANTILAKELFLIKSALDAYSLIILNISRFEVGRKFFSHVADQSMRVLTIGFDKVFEREIEEDGKVESELCSIRGIFREAKLVPIRRPDACQRFVTKYAVRTSADWIKDVETTLSQQRPKVAASMAKIAAVRNTRLAHLSQTPSKNDLPPIAAFEDLLGFAFDFHSFVTEAFLNSHSHDVLSDTQVKSSLKRVLEKIGVSPVVSTFSD